MSRFVFITLLLSSLSLRADELPPLETVASVDLPKYMGKWYEIEALPQRFEEGCFGVEAEYTLKPNGRVIVENTCRKGSLNGPVSIARGRAYVADETTNAKLKVSFFWPFYGDYWILALDEQYTYAMVGAPDRKYLWILSREKTLAPSVIDELRAKAKDAGFDISKLRTMPQF